MSYIWIPKQRRRPEWIKGSRPWVVVAYIANDCPDTPKVTDIDVSKGWPK